MKKIFSPLCICNAYLLRVCCLSVFFLTILFVKSLPAQVPVCVTPDVIPPVITPLSGNITIVLGPTGTKTITLADIATITDNCNSNPPYTLSATSFNCSHRGQQSITAIATDGVFGSPPTPSAVSFSQVYGVAVDAAGNIYLADVVNQSIRKISTTGVVSTLAGSGARSYADGTGAAASFNNPLDLVVDAAGNVFVADQGNNRIRKITPAGVVTTFAGSGVAGFADGTGTGARFNEPYGLTIDAAGNLYIADTENNRIRKITPAGVVTTIAGSVAGYQDGSASISKFFRPMDIVVDGAGNLFVIDEANRRIRLIDAAGNVSTFAGNGSLGFIDGTGTAASFNGAFHLTIDPSGNLYLADANNHAIRKITPGAVVSTIAGNGTNGTTDGPGATAQFFYPYGIAGDGAGNLIIGDGLNYKIRRINSANIVSTLAGSGVSGNQNGSIGSPASGNQSTLQITVTVVQSPPVITSPPNPEITISIGANCTAPIPDFKSSATATSGCGTVMLTQSPTQGVPAPLGRRPVTIIATDIYGMESYQTSYINIVDATAPVITPLSNNIVLPLNATGTRTITLADIATIADNCNTNPIYTISPSFFNCSTTGLQNITVTATDGTLGSALTPAAATFNNPFGLDFDAAGNLYIADQENNKIRKISASGIVSTLAGSGNAGYADGTGSAAVFNDPRGIAVDASGNVYTSDIINHRIRKITPSGVVTTFAGGAQGFANGTGASAQFSSPRGLAFDAQGNLYVADAYNARIRKITPGGVVTTVAGTGSFSSVDGPVAIASIYDPVDVAVDAAGNIYVAEASGNKIRKISTNGFVSTIAGDGTYGFNDGPGNTAKFSGPQALSVDGNGNIYVADFGSNRIRKINTTNIVSTVAISGYPSGITIGANGNLYMTDFGNYIKMITTSGVVTTLAGANQTGSQDGSIGVLPIGNQIVLQMPVTITGQSTPVFSTTQSNVFVTANASCTAVLNNYVSAASATASCGGAVTITQTPVAGTVLPFGVTTVTLTATDASNNSATQTFTLTVTDNNAPVITPLSASTIINLGSNGTKTITAADVITISDCNPSTEVRVTPSTFTCADIGNQTITVEATDGVFGMPSPGTVSFKNPVSITSDNNGIIYVADRGSESIRKITPNGVVTLFAGNPASSGGFADGQGINARFLTVMDMVSDAAGNIYIADAGNRRIRKITPGGLVTTVAGNGTASSIDGVGTAASFESPNAITVDAFGNIFVADASKIRKITPGGTVTTIAGTIAGFADGNGLSAKFWGPSGLTTDAAGNLYIADGANHRIRKMTPSADVTTLAGGTGEFGFLDAIVRDADGNMYVCDGENYMIKKVSSTGTISSIAGNGSAGDNDGIGTAASFNGIYGMTFKGGNLYVSEFNNNKIRKVTTNGLVSTFAGSGTPYTIDGNIGGITGNYSSLQIQVQVVDNTPPVINCPANVTTPTTAIHPSQTGWATATDNCTPTSSITLSYTDNSSQGCNMQRTWKATDASGNFSTCIQSIATPQMSVSLGQDMFVLYGALGYVGCKTITPVITGGVAPYTYSWASTQSSANNATSASISICNTTEVTHTYTITVTAANGCVATTTLQLTFINISCSNNNNNVKVTVCLRPQGNPNNCHTVCVSESAAQVLINNGSYYGKCLPNCEIPVQGRTIPLITENNVLPIKPTEKLGAQNLKAHIVLGVTVANNPTQNSFEVKILSTSREKISMRLFDVAGRTIEIKQNIVPGEIINIGAGYISGIYFAEITQKENRKIVKLIKQ